MGANSSVVWMKLKSLAKKQNWNDASLAAQRESRKRWMM